MAYGGLEAEYIHKTAELVHFTAALLIGAGAGWLTGDGAGSSAELRQWPFSAGGREALAAGRGGPGRRRHYGLVRFREACSMALRRFTTRLSADELYRYTSLLAHLGRFSLVNLIVPVCTHPDQVVRRNGPQPLEVTFPEHCQVAIGNPWIELYALVGQIFGKQVYQGLGFLRRNVPSRIIDHLSVDNRYQVRPEHPVFFSQFDTSSSRFDRCSAGVVCLGIVAHQAHDV